MAERGARTSWSPSRAAREACLAVEKMPRFYAQLGRREKGLPDIDLSSMPLDSAPHPGRGAPKAGTPRRYTEAFNSRTGAGRELWARYLELTLRDNPLHILSPMMTEACIAAAETLTFEDIYDYRFPAGRRIGTLVLPETILVDTVSGLGGTGCSAITWYPGIGQKAISTGEWDEPPTTNAIMWEATDSGYFATPIGRTGLAEARKQGYLIPPWLIARTDSFDTLPSQRQAEVERGLSTIKAFVDAVKEQEERFTATREPGTVVKDPTHTFQLRFLMAFHLLLDQDRKVEPRQEQVEMEPPVKPRKGRAPRKGRYRQVTVSDITATRAPHDPSGEHREVNWQHRWVVSMHKRRQPYGPRTDPKYRIIFVGPYVKGPEDAPMKPRYTSVKAAVTPPVR